MADEAAVDWLTSYGGTKTATATTTIRFMTEVNSALTA